ncbi:MAG: hypothetical protein JXR86_18060 [Spirochaetales bacterium]|nr:hypothetical protein [Spirochaetales bacterium]
MANKEFCVISHTHWDREWYLTHEEFRMKLVQLLDRLTAVLEEDSRYIFNMDAQTVVLEDYLEIRPHKKDQLEKLISQGRLVVGPWYVQNDFYLTSGEATVRNLLIGSDIARKFGAVGKTAYVPDQFGLISQLPQIASRFGMDSCVFGRGYHVWEKYGETYSLLKKPTEFRWESPDGSGVVSICMAHWYNNAQRFSSDRKKAEALLKKIEGDFEGEARTPYLLCMNGVDHLEAQNDLLPVLDDLNKTISRDNSSVKQMSLDDYTFKVKSYIQEKGLELETVGTELRDGSGDNILQGTLSSRIYLKVLNADMQTRIESELEPLNAFIASKWKDSSLYDRDYLRHMWKELIKNHAHDSICGCSTDRVHLNMEDRFLRLDDMEKGLRQKGMEFLSDHVNVSDLSSGDGYITVFNSLEIERSGYIECDLEFTAEEGVRSVSILDEEGRDVPFVVLSHKNGCRDIISPINLPGFVIADTYRCRILVENMAPLSVRRYAVKPSAEPVGSESGRGKTAVEGIENEFYRISLDGSGKMSLFLKERGKMIQDFFHLEDGEDCGTAYLHRYGENPDIRTTKGLAPLSVKATGDNLAETIEFEYEWTLPLRYDWNSKKRSGETAPVLIRIAVTLYRGDRQIRWHVDLDNSCEDHRLRAVFAPGISGDFTYASTPYDMIKRDRRDILKEVRDGVQPNSGLVMMKDSEGSFSFVNKGIYSYEHKLDDSLAVGLLRSNGYIFINAGGEGIQSDMWSVPGNQCKRKISLDFALLFGGRDASFDEMLREEKKFRSAPLSLYRPVNRQKFQGGRPAVQDTEIMEIFYEKIPYSDTLLPSGESLLKVEAEGLIMTACKLGERDARMLVLRYYNPGREARKIAFGDGLLKLNEVFDLDLGEEITGTLAKDQSNWSGIIGKAEIRTFGIRF